MPRTARVAPGGMVYHVLNRDVGRMRLFHTDADYAAWERVIRGKEKGKKKGTVAFIHNAVSAS